MSKTAAASQRGGHGFGDSSSQRRQPSKPPESRQFEDEDAPGPDEAGFSSRPEYSIYSDAGYRPKRFIGPVELITQGEKAILILDNSRVTHQVGTSCRARL